MAADGAPSLAPSPALCPAPRPAERAGPSLFVARTTAEGIMLAAFVAALTDLLADLGGHGIPARFHTLDGRDIGTQRDRLVQRFLASGATHLLFIDSDMVFAPDLARRLLGFGRPLIGVAYTKRMLDRARLDRLAARMPWDRALALAHGWNVRMLDRTFTVRDGLCRVAGLGGGFLLIRRDCFADMAARLRPASGRPEAGMPDLPVYADDPTRIGYFSELPEGEAVLDSEYAFCRRWLACGGEVWACADADVRHCGDARGVVTLLDYLKARQAAEGGTGRTDARAP